MKIVLKQVKNGIIYKLCSGIYGCGKYLHPDYFTTYTTKSGLIKQNSKCVDCQKVYMKSYAAGDTRIKGMDRDRYVDLQYIDLTPYGVTDYPIKKSTQQQVLTGMFGY
jgi:hypothetical protein